MQRIAFRPAIAVVAVFAEQFCEAVFFAGLVGEFVDEEGEGEEG